MWVWKLCPSGIYNDLFWSNAVFVQYKEIQTSFYAMRLKNVIVVYARLLYKMRLKNVMVVYARLFI